MLGRLTLAVIAGLAVVGCATPRPLPSPGAPVEGPVIVAPPYAEIAAVQNARVAQLQKVHGAGAIELRWTEDGQRHFESGTVELWLQLPRHTALRVSKVGEPLLWLGSDDDGYWLFDLLHEEKTLTAASHDTELDVFGPGMIAVRPLMLLDLMGLGPLPLPEHGPFPPVSWDEAQGGWAVEVPATSPGSLTEHQSRLRLVCEPETLLPKRIELIDGDGSVAVTSDLSEYASVAVENQPVMAWPPLAEVVAIADAAGRGEVKLFLRETTGRIEPELLERVFDIQRLRRAMPPDRIYGDLPQTAQVR